MASSKKEGEVADKRIDEMQEILDELTEDVDKILKDIYTNPLDDEKAVCGIPEEVIDYMEKHCHSMFMGIS